MSVEGCECYRVPGETQRALYGLLFSSGSSDVGAVGTVADVERGAASGGVTGASTGL